MTKAIYIDPDTRTVAQVDLGPSVKDICRLLDSDVFIALYPEDETDAVDHILYVDDTIFFVEPVSIPGAFRMRMFGDRIIYGKAILVCFKTDGSMRNDVTVSWQKIADDIQIVDHDEAFEAYLKKRHDKTDHFLF
jgi:hypothetical protein